MICAMLPLLIIFTSGIATESSIGSVALSELALASLPSVGDGLTTQLVAEAFSQLDVDGNLELSVDEFAPIAIPLYKMFADSYIDDSGEYVLREKFINHVYVPDLHAVSAEEGDAVCAADSIYVQLDSSQMWSDVFGDVAIVDIDTFAQTVYVMIADNRVYSLLDLETLILGDLPTDIPTSISIDEYSTANENCANSIAGRRELFISSSLALRATRFGFISTALAGLGCAGETLFGDDCMHSPTAVGRAMGVGTTLSSAFEGLSWLYRRYNTAGINELPDLPAPRFEEVVIGVPHEAIALTPQGGGINPADFEAAFEAAPEVGAVLEAVFGGR